MVCSLQRKKDMKPSLKLIHARLVAQAGVIAGICAAGVIGYVYHDDTKKKPEGIMIRELRPEDFDARIVPHPVEEEEEASQTETQSRA